MQAKFVNESLLINYYDNYLNEAILNEKLDLQSAKEFVTGIGDKKLAFKKYILRFNKEKNMNTKKYIGILLVMLMMGNMMAKTNKWSSSKDYHKNIDKAAVELVKADNITTEKVKTLVVDILEVPAEAKLPIFSAGAEGLIDDVNNVVSNRMADKKISQYDKYDKDIIQAVSNLKADGETADANLIKAIMIIETGMNPRVNHKGFQGFPQTKQHIIDGVNKRYKTNFVMEDMYDAEKSAEFIHYYVKAIQRSQYVKNTEDVIIAYNWGMGNLGKYKRGEESLPKESKDYVAMAKVLQKYFS